MIHRIWRLSEGGKDNLGLARTGGGQIPGRTPLIEWRGNNFAASCSYRIFQLLSILQ
jgi:hypothetical protein